MWAIEIKLLLLLLLLVVVVVVVVVVLITKISEKRNDASVSYLDTIIK